MKHKNEMNSDDVTSKNNMYRMDRRTFVKMAGTTVGALALGRVLGFDILPRARAFYNSTGLTKFTQPLRGVYPIDPNGIPVAVPDGIRHWKGSKIPAQHYTIDINQYQDTLHPSFAPGSTTLRGYHSRKNLGGAPPQRHLGGIIVAERGIPVQITVQNNLTGDHPLPVDTSITGADGVNRVTNHLHGGEVPWISDGGPYSWFDSAGNYGASAQKGALNIYKVMNPNLKPGQAEYYYPNNQSARMEWYHDHAVGITRINAYSGIASAYIIRDFFERGLQLLGLPDFIENGGHEIPIAIQDKIFVDQETIGTVDPTWPGPKTTGSLWYPHVYEPDRYALDPRPNGPPLPAISAVPEMFGDTMLANGVVFPFAPVEPRRYRLRILNACQARFLNLQLYEDDGTGKADTTKPGPDFLVIGTEGGFLAKPVLVKHSQMAYLSDGVSVDPANPGGSLITAPAERWDIIVDFSGFAGKKLILYNDAPAPYPGGDDANDNQNANLGPDTRNIMRFDVATAITGEADKKLHISPRTPLALNKLSLIDPFLVPLNTSVIDSAAGNVKIPSVAKVVRQLTLNEVFDQYGRLIQMLGTDKTVPLPTGFTMDPETPDAPNNYSRAYVDPTTETPKDGTVEVWQIANLTGDTHPIHFHLVNVQLLARQPFIDANGVYHYSNGVPTYQGPARGPDPTELGWKETVKMNPGEVTTVIMKFDLPEVPFKVPESPRTGGNEYVWHCHILEHEEHDMMRPLVVKEGRGEREGKETFNLRFYRV
jgi:spore coat protein A